MVLLETVSLLQHSESLDFVKSDNEQHQDIKHAVEHHSEQIQLDLLEKSAACLHVDVNYSRALQCYELVFRGQKVKLPPPIDVKIVAWSSHHADGRCMRYQALNSNFNPLSLA